VLGARARVEHPTRGKGQSGQRPVLILSHDIFNERFSAHARADHPALAEALLGEDQSDPNARDRADRESPRPSIA
jgi:hypothetical protein